LVFAVGLLGSALVAIPVIAGTCAYVAAEMFGWRHSLDATFDQARRFYLTLGGCVLAAVLIGVAGVPPIKLLFFSGIAGGIATPLTMALMLLVGRNRSIMHSRCIPLWLAACGWAVTAVVSGATGVYLVQTIAGAGH
ncbi:MAG: divalent metal cation transporter, partial [Candidatus Elarobacter sp.]